MANNLLKEMTLEELTQEVLKQTDHPKRVELINIEIAKRQETK